MKTKTEASVVLSEHECLRKVALSAFITVAAADDTAAAAAVAAAAFITRCISTATSLSFQQANRQQLHGGVAEMILGYVESV